MQLHSVAHAMAWERISTGVGRRESHHESNRGNMGVSCRKPQNRVEACALNRADVALVGIPPLIEGLQRATVVRLSYTLCGRRLPAEETERC